MDTETTPAAVFLSWAPEVIADETGNWLSNGLCFATEVEAKGYNAGLLMRWTAVRDTREVPHTDPVKNTWGSQSRSVVPAANRHPKPALARVACLCRPNDTTHYGDQSRALVRLSCGNPAWPVPQPAAPQTHRSYSRRSRPAWRRSLPMCV
jgi:hypothetical protein